MFAAFFAILLAGPVFAAPFPATTVISPGGYFALRVTTDDASGHWSAAGSATMPQSFGEWVGFRLAAPASTTMVEFSWSAAGTAITWHVVNPPVIQPTEGSILPAGSVADPGDWIALSGGCMLRGVGAPPRRTPSPKTVCVSPFALAAAEATESLWSRCVSAGRCAVLPQSGHPRRAQANMSYAEAQEFCAWLGGRLPTETEWEFAASAGGVNPLFPWGATADPVPAHDWPHAVRSERAPTDVAQWPANPWGFYDMAGNVAEWTLDVYDLREEPDPSPFDPLRRGSGLVRVVRGGGWDSRGNHLAVWARDSLTTEEDLGRSPAVGVRCAIPGWFPAAGPVAGVR